MDAMVHMSYHRHDSRVILRMGIGPDRGASCIMAPY